MPTGAMDGLFLFSLVQWEWDAGLPMKVLSFAFLPGPKRQPPQEVEILSMIVELSPFSGDSRGQTNAVGSANSETRVWLHNLR